MEGETLQLKSFVWGKEDGSVSKVAEKHTWQPQRRGGGDRQIPGLSQEAQANELQASGNLCLKIGQCS